LQCKDHKELTLKTAVAELKTEKKHFIDTIKLIAYGAESALAGEIRETLFPQAPTSA
jgi:hypothetical protein